MEEIKNIFPNDPAEDKQRELLTISGNIAEVALLFNNLANELNRCVQTLSEGNIDKAIIDTIRSVDHTENLAFKKIEAIMETEYYNQLDKEISEG